MTDNTKIPAEHKPHYWIYKATRRQIRKTPDIEPKDYIWNRWSCEELSDEDKRKYGVDGIQQLNADEKTRLLDFINKRLKRCGQEELRKLRCPKEINFCNTLWKKKVDFREFIFTGHANFW